MVKESVKKQLEEKIKDKTRRMNLTVYEIHDAVAETVMEDIKERWNESKERHDKGRKASYLSMEFLVGRAVYNNLLCTGLTETVEEALKEKGKTLNELEEIEDSALGNGGLGRLAACFLDSAATINVPLDGYGIRYKYGLFKQKIKNGYQIEEADNWTKHGDPWSIRAEADSVKIKFSDLTVMAVPYDYPVIGYGTENIGTMRLWQAEPVNEFDFKLFNEQKYSEAVKEKTDVENISRVLYPNDDTDAGKILRLRQEYFFSAASIADLLRKHVKNFGSIKDFEKYNSIQLNDTHPVIAIPELIRQLKENYGKTFKEAFEISRKIFNYTNHTVMAEALEKWNGSMIERILPEVYKVIIEINEHFVMEMYTRKLDKSKIEKMKLINGETVRMANIAVYSSSAVNGVAKIHSEILIKDVLKDWYEVYPEKFQNKTNGITQRRWFALCNKEMTAFAEKLLGNNNFITDLSELKNLEKFADDDKVLQRFMSIKSEKKKQLSEYIKLHDNIETDSETIFDIQIKRLHEYKRQLLNAFSILYIYFGIKDGSIKDFTPTTFIFGAKAAPGYRTAKGIIKFINEISNLVNNDEATRNLIKVVFVANYNVSYAEKIVAGADVSEQISTAGTEASGTGNMKFMLNGTVTLGTYDGANVEIVEEAGEENNYIFGARVEDLEKLMPTYDPREVAESNPKIMRVLNTLIDGTLSDDGTGVFREMYYSLMDGEQWHRADNYYLIGDLEDYVALKLRINREYKDKKAFARKCFINMCRAGKFSSDRTIRDYAENIWHI